MASSADTIARFNDLAARLGQFKNIQTGFASRFGLEPEVQAWVTEASAAIVDVFPSGHEVSRQWRVALDRRMGKENLSSESFAQFHQLAGIFAGAHNLIKNGHLAGFADSIRVTSEVELLEQAELLLQGKFVAAATTLAGGALEMHLKALCEKAQLAIPSKPSIAAYDQLFGTIRGQGKPVYGKAESSEVVSWGQKRNDAAHSPGTFNLQPREVQLMIDGIRHFISKTS